MMAAVHGQAPIRANLRKEHMSSEAMVAASTVAFLPRRGLTASSEFMGRNANARSSITLTGPAIREGSNSTRTRPVLGFARTNSTPYSLPSIVSIVAAHAGLLCTHGTSQRSRPDTLDRNFAGQAIRSGTMSQYLTYASSRRMQNS